MTNTNASHHLHKYSPFKIAWPYDVCPFVWLARQQEKNTEIKFEQDIVAKLSSDQFRDGQCPSIDAATINKAHILSFFRNTSFQAEYLTDLELNTMVQIY